MNWLEVLLKAIPKFVQIISDRRITPDEYDEAADLISTLAERLAALARILRNKAVVYQSMQTED